MVISNRHISKYMETVVDYQGTTLCEDIYNKNYAKI